MKWAHYASHHLGHFEVTLEMSSQSIFYIKGFTVYKFAVWLPPIQSPLVRVSWLGRDGRYSGVQIRVSTLYFFCNGELYRTRGSVDTEGRVRSAWDETHPHLKLLLATGHAQFVRNLGFDDRHLSKQRGWKICTQFTASTTTLHSLRKVRKMVVKYLLHHYQSPPQQKYIILHQRYMELNFYQSCW